MACCAQARANHLDTLGVYMQTGRTIAAHLTIDMSNDIRTNISAVDALRTARAGSVALEEAVQSIKALQSQRFAHAYQDLLASTQFASVSRFFLEELYGARDFSQRDAQFSRIASTLQRVFPASVVLVATDLAALHALSESLDDSMARRWLALGHLPAAARYLAAWRGLGQQPMRQQQLDLALHIGHALDKLTGTPGLRTMLKLMRSPAAAAGLSDLQRFLETGFDTFHAMRRNKGACAQFLNTIATRESLWMQQLFDAPPEQCCQQLSFT
jgi:hypothetical protein